MAIVTAGEAEKAVAVARLADRSNGDPIWWMASWFRFKRTVVFGPAAVTASPLATSETLAQEARNCRDAEDRDEDRSGARRGPPETNGP